MDRPARLPRLLLRYLLGGRCTSTASSTAQHRRLPRWTYHREGISSKCATPRNLRMLPTQRSEPVKFGAFVISLKAGTSSDSRYEPRARGEPPLRNQGSAGVSSLELREPHRQDLL